MRLALRRALGFPCGTAAPAAAAQVPAAQRSGVAERGRRPNPNGAESGANRHRRARWIEDRALNAQRSCRAKSAYSTSSSVGNEEVGVVAR